MSLLYPKVQESVSLPVPFPLSKFTSALSTRWTPSHPSVFSSDTSSPNLSRSLLSWAVIFHLSVSLGFIPTTINTYFLSYNIYLLSSHCFFLVYEFLRQRFSVTLSPSLDTDNFFNKNLCIKSISVYPMHILPHILYIFLLIFPNTNTYTTRNHKAWK